jgi:hypothetical protein
MVGDKSWRKSLVGEREREAKVGSLWEISQSAANIGGDLLDVIVAHMHGGGNTLVEIDL